jgi:chaperonin cofactor prefoldin
MLLDKFQQLEGRIRELLAERDALKVHAEQLKATGGPTEDIDDDDDGLQQAYDLLMRERERIRSRVEGLVGIISRLNKAN